MNTICVRRENFETLAEQIRFDIESIHENTSLNTIHDICVKWEGVLKEFLSISVGDEITHAFNITYVSVIRNEKTIPRLLELLISVKLSESAEDAYKHLSEAVKLSDILKEGWQHDLKAGSHWFVPILT